MRKHTHAHKKTLHPPAFSPPPVPRRRLPQHPDLGPAQPAGARQHHGAHPAVELGSDLQLRVPHAPQQARRPLLQRPHAVPRVPVHPARLHQRDARPAGPQYLQVGQSSVGKRCTFESKPDWALMKSCYKWTPFLIYAAHFKLSHATSFASSSSCLCQSGSTL